MARNKRRAGSILVEALLSLLIALTTLPLILSCLFIHMKSIRFQENAQDEIAIAQLQHILNTSNKFNVSTNELSFHYHNETYRLYFVNHHLILSPGTQIFLSDIDTIQFFQDNNYIFCRYTRKNIIKESVLTHV